MAMCLLHVSERMHRSHWRHFWSTAVAYFHYSWLWRKTAWKQRRALRGPVSCCICYFSEERKTRSHHHADHISNKLSTIYRCRDMASASSAICGMVAMITLEPSDISGAALEEPFEAYAMPALRWWLLCRGIKAPVSWKKQLITR